MPLHKYAVACGLALAALHALPRCGAQDIPLSKILVEGDSWRPIADLSAADRKVLERRTQTTVTTKLGAYALDSQGRLVGTIQGKKIVCPVERVFSCLTVWPDEGHLVLAERGGAWLWAIRIEADGGFGPGDRYYSLRTQADKAIPVSALVMDAGFLLYACTPLGIQVFDPTGRLSGVIPAPAKGPMTSITIGGADGQTLLVSQGNKIYGRKIQGKSARK